MAIFKVQSQYLPGKKENISGYPVTWEKCKMNRPAN
jgi:hypothetical protein